VESGWPPYLYVEDGSTLSPHRGAPATFIAAGKLANKSQCRDMIWDTIRQAFGFLQWLNENTSRPGHGMDAGGFDDDCAFQRRSALAQTPRERSATAVVFWGDQFCPRSMSMLPAVGNQRHVP